MADLERTVHVLEVVRREMLAYAWAWRGDWSDFDGRQLEAQIEELDEWVSEALLDEPLPEYTGGTDFRRTHGS